MPSSRVINSERTRTLAITGIMCGIAVVLSFPFVGTIMLPTVAATVAFLPILVAAMTLGLVPGLAVATVAGAASWIRALTLPATLLSPYFMNPLVSVLPRMMIAVTVYLCFRGLMSIPLPKSIDKAPIAVGISAAAGSATNTAAVLGSLYLYYAAPLLNDGPLFAFHAPPLANQLYGAGIEGGVTAFLLGIVGTNGVIELIVNSLIATVLVLTLRNAKFSKI